MTREEVITRFCQLQAEVTHNHIGYQTANDCFCENPKMGGHQPGYSAKGYFRSDGTALEFIERVVRQELDRLKQEPSP